MTFLECMYAIPFANCFDQFTITSENLKIKASSVYEDCYFLSPSGFSLRYYKKSTKTNIQRLWLIKIEITVYKKYVVNAQYDTYWQADQTV